jgi:MFS family permease
MSTSSIIKGLLSYRLSFSLGRGAFACFIPIFAATCLGLSPALIGILLAANMLLMSLLQPFTGKIADRFNRRAMVVVGSLINLTFLALIPMTHNFWYLLGVCALSGLGGAISMPAALALTVNEGRKFGMGSAMGVFAMAFSIGMAIGPLLSGIIADFADINSVFYLAAVMVLVGTNFFTWFTR